MKKRFFLFLILFSLIMPSFVNAKSISGVVSGTDVRLRKGPGTNYDKIKSVSTGETFNMNTDELFKDEGGCPNGWYKIIVDGADAYICSNYLKLTVIEEPK